MKDILVSTLLLGLNIYLLHRLYIQVWIDRYQYNHEYFILCSNQLKKSQKVMKLTEQTNYIEGTLELGIIQLDLIEDLKECFKRVNSMEVSWTGKYLIRFRNYSFEDACKERVDINMKFNMKLFNLLR